MIGISAICSYIPNGFIDIADLADSLRLSSSTIKKIGIERLPIKDDTEDTITLGIKAVEELLRRNQANVNSIDLIVFVTQNPTNGGLPHCSARLHAELGFSKATCAFDVGLGCSGYVYGLAIIKAMMLSEGYKNGLLVTSDPYSLCVDPNDRNTAPLFGDAATATMLSRSGELKIGASLLETDGSGWLAIYRESGFLKMNGRQVFDFAKNTVPDQIRRVLIKNNLCEEDIDIYCLHQGSKFIVDTIASRFSSSDSRFIRDIDRTGNTVSSSIPLLLEQHVMGKRHKHVLLSGFGVGLSAASTVLTRDSKVC